MAKARMIVWTRSRLDWSDDQELLAGMPCLHVPLVEFQAVEESIPPLKARYGLITSPHAVAFARQSALVMQRLQSLERVFTFGVKTAAVLQEAGLAVARIEARHGADMVAALSSHVQPGSAFLIFGARHLAFDAISALKDAGFPAAHWVLYETRLEKNLSPVHRKALHETPAVIALASPSAAEALHSCLANARLSLHPDSHIVCLGDTTTQRARSYFKNVDMAANPQLPSLISQCGEYLTKRG